MKFTLPLWLIPLFFGYWASIVLAYPVATQAGSLSIRDSLEPSDVQLSSRSWTESDDIEDLERRGKFTQKVKNFHQKYISRGSKSQGKKPMQVHVSVHQETKVHNPTHFDKIAGKKLPPLPPRHQSHAPAPAPAPSNTRYPRPTQVPVGPRPRPRPTPGSYQLVRPDRRPVGPRPQN